MGKAGDGSRGGVKYDRRSFGQVNYLLQAAAFLSTRCPNLSRNLTREAVEVAQKHVIRLSPETKRTVCRGCYTPLTPGHVRMQIEEQTHGKEPCLVAYTCGTCRQTRRYKPK